MHLKIVLLKPQNWSPLKPLSLKHDYRLQGNPRFVGGFALLLSKETRNEGQGFIGIQPLRSGREKAHEVKENLGMGQVLLANSPVIVGCC